MTTPLSPGDIYIIGFRSGAPDGLAFVTLRDLTPGTQLGFTDAGYQQPGNPNSWRGSENFAVWTTSTAIPAGTVVVLSFPDAGASADLGTIAGNLNGISGSGDQIFIYQRSDGTVGTTTPFTATATAGQFSWNASVGGQLLFGINVASVGGFVTTGTGNLNSTNTSYVPDAASGAGALTLGTTALSITTTGLIANAQYDGPRTGLTADQLRTALLDQTNWVAVPATGGLLNSSDITLPGALPSVNLSVSTSAGSEAGQTVVTVTAAATAAVTGDQTVQLTVTGTNITTDDYTLSNPVITIANGQTSGSVTFTVVDDALVEGPETAVLTISNPSTGIVLGGTVSQSITITDNDVPANQAPTIQVDLAATSNFLDGGSAAALPATGSGAVSGVIGNATDPARTLGIDFAIADPDTPVGNLTVTVASSNQSVVGAANLSLTGTGATRNLRITPVGVGRTDITVTVSDGSNSSTYTINYAASAASLAQNGLSRFHTGTSDASTAVALDADFMLVADDEDQTIRLYDRTDSGLPIASFDFTSALGLTQLSGGVPREVDIEASARLGNVIYWMASHSNSSGGADRPNRSRLFATEISGSGSSTTLSFVGRYSFLKRDLIAWDNGNGHGLGAGFLGLAASAATGVIPESPNENGFNIEGFAIAPDNTTAYLAFRAPLEPTSNRTQALIVPVLNFTSLLSPTGSIDGPASFGAPIFLDLGDRGIREITRLSSGEYVIIAGPPDGATGVAPKDFRLFTWTGNPADAPVLRATNLTALNADGSFESILEGPTPGTVQVVVDNGDSNWYNDTPPIISKDLPQTNWQKFRSDVVALGGTVAATGSGPLINEFVLDHVGTDFNEYVEVLGQPNTSLFDFWVLSVEGDSAENPGNVDRAFRLGTTDAQGLFTTGYLNSQLENGTLTLLLVQNFSGEAGTTGTDLDTNNDGVLDLTPWTLLSDSVAVTDNGVGDRTYSPTVLAPNFDGSSFNVGGASRIPNGGNQWWRNDFGAEGIPGFNGNLTAAEALNTPADPNRLNYASGGGTAPTNLRIAAIQGVGHRSIYEGQTVTAVPGIVTALVTSPSFAQGFYMQDPTGDGDDRTSEGIFVLTGASIPAGIVVGASVNVTGVVEEFRPAANVNNLTITRLRSINPGQVTVTGTGSVAATLVGQGGRAIPTQVISNFTGQVDNDTSLDVTTGIDFYESLEGMLVQVNTPVAVSATNSFGEIWVLADNGAGATGRTSRGGIAVSPGDFNPERIQIDDDLVRPTNPSPSVNVGGQLGNVTGVISYNFNNYELLTTAPLTVTTPSTLQREVTTLRGEAASLTMATFNIENFDPSDVNDPEFNDPVFGRNRAAAIADRILNNLGAPDIIGLQEVQDNTGATDNGVVDASQTAQTLINAIQAAGGPLYAYIDLPPVNNQDGGQPGGNIRPGFLYRVDRVQYVTGSAVRLDPNNPAFLSSRKPLAAQFIFQGNIITVISNHFNSKGGDQSLFGPSQPPTLITESQRLAQAQVVRDYVASLVAANPNAKVVVLGDLNDFQFSPPLALLQQGGLLRDLVDATNPDSEQYTFNFQGNSQALDHILVTANLQNRATVDIVHINSEFADGVSDHDPIVARFTLPVAPTALRLSNNQINENVAIGTEVGSFSTTDANTGETFTYTLVPGDGATDNASFTINGDRLTLAVIPNFEVQPSYSIRVRTTDRDGLFLDQVFTVTVLNVNEAPTANNDSFTATEGTPLTLTVAQLLANDSDPDAGTALSITAFTPASNGSLVRNPDGSFTYTANFGFSGTDSFTYTVSDGSLSATATVTLTVNPFINEIVGTNGDDRLTGTTRIDRIRGLAGKDLIRGLANNDLLFGDADDDTLQGNEGDDRLEGGTGKDRLEGGSDNDTLLGGADDDQLFGGLGDDVLTGGAGSDRLSGGGGNDTFVFTALTDATDTITDFATGSNVLNLAPLFSSLGYTGSNPIADGTLRFVRVGNSTQVRIDADGLSGPGQFIDLVTLNGITPTRLSVGGNVLIA